MCDNLRIYIDQNKSRVRASEDERNPADGICVSHLGLDLEHKKKKASSEQVDTSSSSSS